MPTTVKSDADKGLAETQPAEHARAAPSTASPATEPSHIDIPARSAIGSVDGPAGTPAVRPPTGNAIRTNQPHELPDRTRTSQPDPIAVTRTSQPDQPDKSLTRVARPAMAPQLRDHDRYDILGEHGRGGLGRVSRAHDRELGRDIAIKELISRGHLSEVRFLREALITARLEHPGIVPVYEAGRWADGTPFYAMKLVSGRPLRDLIAERKTVEERIGLLHHVIAVADAIAYAHGRNIIHRDLKPANVIVGEFGETVVIDWGLAKDVSAAEEPPSASGSFRTTHDDGLTSAGTVLGTPAYMAPEQARGESVDRRADVFAIGAMLWELCSLHKLPPNFSGQRRRLLRNTGIDPDLITIVEKAVAPDPTHRYPDAGALAADLKAFKAGVRIAARRYSVWALLTHWTRRNRTLALSTVAAISLGVTGVVLYIRNIAAERDRADTSEAAANASLDAMMLDHAQLLLSTDPSAANDVLTAYHGKNLDRAAQIRADGVGRGLALLRAKPHTDRVRWVTGTRDGSVISLSTDGTITRTSADNVTTVLARGVSTRGRFAYSRARGLLAYACDPADVCLWDVTHSQRIPSSPLLQRRQLGGFAISHSGLRLALLSPTGLIEILDLSDPARPILLLHIQEESGVGMIFINDDTLAIGRYENLSIELLHVSGTRQALVIGDTFVWDASPDGNTIVLGTQHGEGIYLRDVPLRIVKRITLCHETVTGIKLIHTLPQAAYACKEGTIGTWNLDDSSSLSLAHIEGHADSIEVDSSGDYIAAAGINGTLSIIDLKTKLLTSYRGHGFRLTSVFASSADFPYFVSGDAHGSVRVWPRPSRIARIVANVQTRFTSALFDNTGDTIIAATFRPELTVVSSWNPVHAISPHLANAMYLELATKRDAFVAYGPTESIEIWTFNPLIRRSAFNSGHGTISRAAFVSGSNDLVTGGSDGRVIYWTPAGDNKRIVQFDSSVMNLTSVPGSTTTLVNTADGALWRTDSDGNTVSLRGPGHPITRMESSEASPIAIGDASGEVFVVDSTSWQQTPIFHGQQAIRDISITKNGRTIAVADNDDTIHIGHTASRWDEGRPAWTTFMAPAGAIALTSDEILIMVGSEGIIWLYFSSCRSWMYLRTSTSDLNIIRLAADERSAAAFDTDGRVIRLDLELARQSMLESSKCVESRPKQ